MSGLGMTFLRRGNLAYPVKGVIYVKFKDDAVFNILMANGVSSDGVGITRDDISNVTTIGLWFKDNKEITSFEELKEFTSVTTLEASAFSACTALSSIDVSNITSIGSGAFASCTSLTGRLNLPNVLTINSFAFSNSKVTSIKALSAATISRSAFHGAKSIQSIILKNVTSVGDSAFAENSSLTALVILATTPPASATNIFPYADRAKIYIPDESVDSYKTASGWSSYTGRIRSISQLATDNPTLYAEIEEYL